MIDTNEITQRLAQIRIKDQEVCADSQQLNITLPDLNEEQLAQIEIPPKKN
jgi:hypothetical protein